jgi:hypothetical protein
MKSVELKLPELGLLAITRVALGAGLALLVSSHLDNRQRRAAGVALTLDGILTTIPFAVRVWGEDD